MRLQLVRHATLRLEMGKKTILVDPMLADAGSTPPIQNGPDDRKNPLVPLPMTVKELLHGVDTVLVTHTHRDHWDGAAAEQLSKALPIYCQPQNEQRFRDVGFRDVYPIDDRVVVGGNIEVRRTGGQHGTGEIGKKMAPVSGFVLVCDGTRLYIAGDTIWCDEVRDAIAAHRPTHIVVNAGAAQFTQGDPITMTPRDVEQVCKAAPDAQVIAVHMESINHCLVTRADLARYFDEHNLHSRVRIPGDGEWIVL